MGWNPFEKEVKKKPKIAPIKTSKQEVIHRLLWAYLERHKSNWREKTLKGYQSFLRRFTQWLIANGYGELHIKEFDFEKAYSYFRYLKEDQKLSNVTHNSHLDFLRKAFAFYVKKDFISQNPLQHIENLKENKNGLNYFSKQQERIMLDAAKDQNIQLWLFLTFMHRCFIRPKELYFLQVRDFNLQDYQVTVRGEISKNKKTQNVILHDEIVAYLVSIDLYSYPQKYFLFGRGGLPSDEHYSINYFYQRHLRLMQATLGFGTNSGYSLYSWKHTGICKAARNPNVTVKDVQMQARHHSLDETDKYMRKMMPGNNSPFRSME